jgi:hypothetical protein
MNVSRLFEQENSRKDAKVAREKAEFSAIFAPLREIFSAGRVPVSGFVTPPIQGRSTHTVFASCAVTHTRSPATRTAPLPAGGP